MDDVFYDAIDSPFGVGDQVPEELSFEIFNGTDIKVTSFGAWRGKWLVLFFYPGDFTFVCPTELAEMADLYKEFVNNEAKVISVSTDSAFVHKAWHDSSEAIKKVQYPMGADPSHKLARFFGVLISDEGVALRGTFIISPAGIIKTIEINDNAVGRNATETLRKFKAAKFVEENPSKVCPASWKEGDKTLTPGLDLVGKI